MGDEAEADVHIVNQLHLTTWPDHSVPGNINSLIGNRVKGEGWEGVIAPTDH